jgi:hypothetical protein
MCTTFGAGSMPILGGGSNRPSPGADQLGTDADQYSKNYGYGSASGPPSIAEEERQWYIDQGFGDPNEVVGKRATRSRLPPGLGVIPVGSRIRTPYLPASDGSYRGVSPEARYLYTQSSIPKTVYLQERAPSAATSLGVPANTRYAGKSLTINPVTS